MVGSIGIQNPRSNRQITGETNHKLSIWTTMAEDKAC